ncbi:aa3-type cytochrome c oxidase subunit IV [Brevundimonas sp. R86498]|uniref:aa3-type cytochrome c oxidase subunit IV n=1 Tax=Brevundimonas sp. R86498 TaxID=3093845 RepID=UPI0037C62F3D
MAKSPAHHSSTEAADHDAQAYVRGTMTIEEQSATFALFMSLAKWGSLAVASILLLLVLWFQPGGSLFLGLGGGLVLAVAGWFFLKGGKPAAH